MHEEHCGLDCGRPTSAIHFPLDFRRLRHTSIFCFHSLSTCNTLAVPAHHVLMGALELTPTANMRRTSCARQDSKSSTKTEKIVSFPATALPFTTEHGLLSLCAKDFRAVSKPTALAGGSSNSANMAWLLGHFPLPERSEFSVAASRADHIVLVNAAESAMLPPLPPRPHLDTRWEHPHLVYTSGQEVTSRGKSQGP